MKHRINNANGIIVPSIKAELNGNRVNAFLDTGASATLIAHTVLNPAVLKKLKQFEGQVCDASGNEIPILGVGLAQVDTPAGSFDAYVLVYEKSDAQKHKMLVGMNILRYSNINFMNKELKFSPPDPKTRVASKIPPSGLRIKISDGLIQNDGTNIAAQVTTENGNCNTRESETSLSAATNTLDTECETEATDNNGGKNEEHSGHTQPTLSNETNPLEIPVYLRKEVTIQNNAVMLTTLPINKQIENGRDLVLYHNHLGQSVFLASVVSRVTKHKIQVNIMNFGDKPVTLPKGTQVCTAAYLDESNNVETINLAADQSPTNTAPGRKLTRDDIVCDDSRYTDDVLRELNKYRNACWLPGEPLGTYTGDQLEIKLKENKIINRAQYRIPYAFQAKLDEYIARLLKEGTITRSKSSYNSPLIIVKRPDGDIRPCIDYRALNEIMETVSFPLPRISDLLNSLGQATYISQLDLASAFHQIKIKPCDREKTAFTVKNTKYEWTRVPFGLQSSPAFFARVINEVLFDILGPQTLAYMDDLLVFSPSAHEHLDALRRVLERLASANIKLKITKCRFFANEVKFLGYQVSKSGMRMNQERVSAIRKIPTPTNKRQLQAFLGVVNYYRVFVHNFASIADPLYDLLRKNVPFVWTAAHTKAIETLKHKLASAPIVKFPNFSRPFHLYTDASKVGIAAVLMQEINEVLHPVSYFSKTLNKSQRNWSTTKRETFSLAASLEHFRYMVLAFDIYCYTDHRPLVSIVKQGTKDETLNRWMLGISEYAVKMRYVEGKKNIFSDALSRLPDPHDSATSLTEELENRLDERNAPYDKRKILHVVLHNAINDDTFLSNDSEALSDYIPVKWPWKMEQLQTAQKTDQYCKNLREQLKGKKRSGKTVPSNLLLNSKILNGTIYILRKIKRSSLVDEFLVPYIPDSLMNAALRVMHSDNTAGHKGPERTLKLFTRNFYNVHERKLVYEYCDDCELCTKAKKSPKKVPILKYPVPLRPFDTITSDVIGPISITANGHQFILTVRDYTTRYTILFPMAHKTSDTIIDALRQVISHYGSSRVLITDNAAEYQSNKLLRFLNHYNTRHLSVSVYHPQSNGLSERVNLEVGKLLRIYTEQYAINDWDSLLPVIQLAINNTYNSSIAETPFYALYSFDSGTVTLSPPKLNYSEDELSQHMLRVAKVREHCREKLLQAQAAYTDYTNCRRCFKDIRVGERVYANITKHRHSPKRKLDMPVSGPFKVIRAKGNSWVLEELATGKTFVVHPDYIIQSAAQRKRLQLDTRAQIGNSKADASSSVDDTDDDTVVVAHQTAKTTTGPRKYNFQPTNAETTVPKTTTPPTRIQPPRSSKHGYRS